MSTKVKAYLVGAGIGPLAATAFMIRNGGLPGGNISVLEPAPVMGGKVPPVTSYAKSLHAQFEALIEAFK
jgi:myosin-crossreactive antigen